MVKILPKSDINVIKCCWDCPHCKETGIIDDICNLKDRYLVDFQGNFPEWCPLETE